MDIRYELVPLSNFIAKNVERAIQTFKTIVLERLCSVDKDLKLQLLDRLL